jgi:ATP-binding cassette subfamily C (CFTR/MRP) protein 10
VAARRVEQRLLSSVLGATSAFFDSNPTGRLLNRFSSDVYGVDDSLPFIMNILFAQTFGLLGTLAVMSYSQPYFVMILFPLGWIYTGIQRYGTLAIHCRAVFFFWKEYQIVDIECVAISPFSHSPCTPCRYYRQTAREIKRLGSIARSPIYDHFGEALTGAATIRAIRQVKRFERDSCLKMENSQVCTRTDERRSNDAFLVACIFPAYKRLLIFFSLPRWHRITSCPCRSGWV